MANRKGKAKENDPDELNAVNAIRFLLDAYSGDVEPEYGNPGDPNFWERTLPFLEGAVTRREMANRVVKALKGENAERDFTQATDKLRKYWKDKHGYDGEFDFEKVFTPALLEPEDDDPRTTPLRNVLKFANDLARQLGYKEQTGKDGAITAQEQMHADRKDDTGAVVGKDGSAYDRLVFDGDQGGDLGLPVLGDVLFKHRSKGWGPALGRRVRALYDDRDENGGWHPDAVVEADRRFSDFKRAMGFSPNASVEDVERYVDGMMQRAHKKYYREDYKEKHPFLSAVYDFFNPSQAEALDDGRSPDLVDTLADAATLGVGVVPVAGAAGKAAQALRGGSKAAKAAKAAQTAKVAAAEEALAKADIARKAAEVAKTGGADMVKGAAGALPYAVAQEIVDLGHDLAKDEARSPELYVRKGDPRSVTGYNVDFPDMANGWEEDKEADRAERLGRVADLGGRAGEALMTSALLGGVGGIAGAGGKAARMARMGGRALGGVLGPEGAVAAKQAANRADAAAEKAKAKAERAAAWKEVADGLLDDAEKAAAKAPKSEKAAEKLKYAQARAKGVDEQVAKKELELESAVKDKVEKRLEYMARRDGMPALGLLLADRLSPKWVDRVADNYGAAVRFGRSQLAAPGVDMPGQALVDMAADWASRKTGLGDDED